VKSKEKRERNKGEKEKIHYSLTIAISCTQAKPSGRVQLETSNTITEGNI